MRKLYIEQAIFKITDHYPILDQAGAPVYQVDQDFTFFGHHARLSAPDGGEIFEMERVLLTFLPKYEVRFRDGPTAAIESEISLLRRRMTVEMDGLDFRLEGNFFDHEFSLYQGDRCVGEIRKKFFSFRDCFEITVWDEDESVETLMIAVMIAVDNLKDNDKEG